MEKEIDLQTLLSKLDSIPIEDISRKRVVFHFTGKDAFLAKIEGLDVYLAKLLEHHYRLLVCKDGLKLMDFSDYEDIPSETRPEIAKAYEFLYSRYMIHRNQTKLPYSNKTERLKDAQELL